MLKILHALDKQALIALLAIAGIFLFLLLHFLPNAFQNYAQYPLYIVMIVGGMPLVWDLLKKTVKLDFGSDLLAGLSIVTAVLLEEYLAGSLVVLMLSGGQTIENYALRTASKMLEALAQRTPTKAHRICDQEIQEISIVDLKINDRVIIFPHEICPVDGIVLEGDGVMDESYLTGEPFMMSKAPGSEVLSGAINGDSSITIKATKTPQDSRFAKIIQVISETAQKKPRLRRLADQLGAWYTPLAVAIALLAWMFSGDPIRFLAVLVIATPCPLLIAIPVAIIGSISLCAKRGILIKNPIVLEQLDQCQTMIFDKTGTLTYGKPTLNEETLFNGWNSLDVLRLASSLERYSKHPLAGAVLAKAKQNHLDLIVADEISEPKGQGLKGVVNGHNITVTNRKGLVKLGYQKELALLPEGAGLECIILIDQTLAAHYRFRDAPRFETTSFIHHLPKMHGIEEIMIISGDRQEEVQYLAEAVGINKVYANQSPEEKVRLVVQETHLRKTAYLGDGINDAPALMAATVGIAFGLNSDITAEAADAVIMDSSLEKVDEFLHLSRRMRKIALESAVGGMILSLLGMLVAAFGFLPPVLGAIAQEIIDIAAIMNSLRTIRAPKIITDMPPVQNRDAESVKT